MTFNPLGKSTDLELVEEVITYDSILLAGLWKDADGTQFVGQLAHEDDEIDSMTYVLAPTGEDWDEIRAGRAEFRQVFTRGAVLVITVLHAYTDSPVSHTEELRGSDLPEAMLPARGATFA